MKDKFSIFNIVAALGVGLGTFQFLSSYGLFNNLKGFIYYIPLVLLCLFYLFLLSLVFVKKNKSHYGFLIIITLLGFLMASLYGHKSFERQILNQPGAVKVE